MEDILKYCIKVNGVHAYYPIFGEISSKPLSANPEFARKFGWNNGRVAFITEDGSYYVTPFCFEVAEALTQLGYEDVHLYVPFSNGEIPSDSELQAKWKKLCEDARKKYAEKAEAERQERIRKIAEEKGLRELPEDAYKMSLEIPQEGLETIRLGGTKSLTSPIQDWQLPDCMGIYWQNNGKIAFVDAHGTMYVTPFTSELRSILAEAGYQERSIFVPLSNGEKISNPHLAAQWEVLCNEERELYEAKQRKAKEETIRKIAEEKGLGELPEDVYEKSLLLPEEGLETLWWGFNRSQVTPVLQEHLPTLMGVYCQNNGKVSFIDANGRMLVTPFCEEVREQLEAAGYHEGSLYVPLSNGEEVVDPVLSERWKKLCEDANQNSSGNKNSKK